MERSILWTVLLALLVFAGCVSAPGPGAPSKGAPTQQPAIDQWSDKLPPLPAGREVDAVFTFEVNGVDTHSRSLNTIDGGSSLDLISGINDVSWGIWQFTLMADLNQVQSVIVVPEGEVVYLALADYSTGSWEFHGPLSAGKTMQLDEAKHKSESGSFFIVAITFGGDTAKVYKHVLTAQSDWMIISVDSSAIAVDLSLAEVFGRPAISYFDYQGDQLKYVRAADTTGASWNVPLDVHGSTFNGGYTSMMLIAARPAISYINRNSDTLFFVRAGDAHGETWNPPIQVYDEVTSILGGTSLARVNGNPAICFTGEMGLRYVRSTDNTGANWPAPISLDNASDYAWGVSLAVDHDFPVVTYEDLPSGYVKLIGASDINGTSWNPPQIVVAGLGGVSSARSSGAIVNFGMAVSYYDNPAKTLSFARWNQMIAEWEYISVDGTIPQETYLSLAVIDGNPAIAYYEPYQYLLKYVRAGNIQGTDWGTPVVVDSIGLTGMNTVLTEINGKAAISYTNQNGNLMYAYQVGP